MQCISNTYIIISAIIDHDDVIDDVITTNP